MQTCAYCGSAVEPVGKGLYCSFCDMEVYQDEVQENGMRRQLLAEKVVFLSAAERSTQELMEKDSYFLTLLLRLVRKERNRTYNLLRVVNKGPYCSQRNLSPDKMKVRRIIAIGHEKPGLLKIFYAIEPVTIR